VSELCGIAFLSLLAAVKLLYDVTVSFVLYI